MALLTPEQRNRAARLFVQKVFEGQRLTATVDVTQILAAVSTADDWLNTNERLFQQALDLGFRTQTSGKVQIELMRAVQEIRQANA